MAEWAQRLLFPLAQRDEQFAKPLIPVAGSLRVWERKIAENKAQLSAVVSLLEHRCRPAPYVVFGPPGTGKTTVVIEAIQQIVNLDPKARVLVCTPSNNAADLVVERLPANWTEIMHRVMAHSRDPRHHSERVKRFCNWKSGEHAFGSSTLKQILSKRVIVSTLMTAGVLYALGVPDDHFTHIILDEAGHATEPEAAIAFAGLSNKNTSIVLVGDPQQLGPIIRSGPSRQGGLDKSLLQRLSERPVYQRNRLDDQKQLVYDTWYITQLVQNFRSHPAILKLPNERFYGGALQACADQKDREAFCNWPGLPRSNTGAFPIVFHSVQGKEEREGDSPSWFNQAEVEVVAQQVKQVLDYKRSGIDLVDIGIIAPYRKQIAKIDQLLRSRGLSLDEKKGAAAGAGGSRLAKLVGSVEEFQGQERRVIIVSTVRASFDELASDARHHLGFLDNWRRFNVAVTRAKALLIVVGDPNVLVYDAHWRAFINYCIDNGSFVGQRPSAEALEGKFPEAAPAADRKEGKQGSGSGSGGAGGGRDGADSDEDDDDNGGGGGAGSAGGSSGGLSLDSVGTFARGEHKGDSKAASASHQQLRQQQARDHEQEALDVLQQQLERLLLRDSSSFASGAGSAGASGGASSSSSSSQQRQQRQQQQSGTGQQLQHTAMRVSRAETEGVEWVDRR